MGGGAGSPDFFYREAQRLGYVARSAFKLLQMQKQFKLIKPGASVLDLGCAPGAWLQVACQNLGPLSNGGAVVGIDVKKVKVPSVHCDDRVRTICGDVMHIVKYQVKKLSYEGKGFSVILSDMCPPVSGIPVKDASLSMELGMQAFSLAVGQAAISANAEQLADNTESVMDFDSLLLRGGNLVVKLLENEDLQEFKQICTPCFKKVSLLRPKATRASSREIYLICQGLC